MVFHFFVGKRSRNAKKEFQRYKNLNIYKVGLGPVSVTFFAPKEVCRGALSVTFFAPKEVGWGPVSVTFFAPKEVGRGPVSDVTFLHHHGFSRWFHSFSWVWWVSMVFQGGFTVFHGFDGFPWFLVGFHGFSWWFHGFSWFLVGFHGFSRW